MTKTTPTPTSYKAAMERLQDIVAEIEQGEAGVDELAERVAEASRLIKFCKEKLTKTEQDVEGILKELG